MEFDSIPVKRARLSVFAALYFAEGAPIGFIWWALPVWLREQGESPADVARIVAWVGWPWALKFVWAPLLDRFGRSTAQLRAWILAAQIAMSVSLLPFLTYDRPSISLMLYALFLHAIFASTQDVGIDALAVRSVPPDRRGRVNGLMQVGMLAARAIFGGGAILVAAHVGQRTVVLALILAILAPAAMLSTTKAITVRPHRPHRAAFRLALRNRDTWVGFLAACTLGAGFESLGAMAGPFLLDRGATAQFVGTFFLVPSVICMACGALLGGRLSDSIGRVPAALSTEAFAALSVSVLGAVAWRQPSPTSLWLCVGLTATAYFAMGLATAGLYALLMERCDERLAATQFALFMAGINVCYVVSTRGLGFLLDRMDYGPAFCVMGLVSFTALPLLLAFRK